MPATLDIPWHRYALIAELAKRMEGRSPEFGKTALQKLVYLLQEVYRVDCGYDFRLHSYGPFQPPLLGELDLAAHFGLVQVSPVDSVTGGYTIRPTDNVDALPDRAVEFMDDPHVGEALDRLVDEYGGMTARGLELRATIVYVERSLRGQNKPATEDEVCRLVGEIRPKYSANDISSWPGHAMTPLNW